MDKRRFKELCLFVSFAMAEKDKEGLNPWWRISSFIYALNKNCMRNFVSVKYKTLDKIMIAFHPRTYQKRNLPHLVYISRKPVLFGIEWKVLCCPLTGFMLGAKLQHGKDCMKHKYLHKELGATAPCTVYLANMTSNCGRAWSLDREIFVGDSWFASSKAAVEL